MNKGAIAIILALIGAFFLAPGILLTLAGGGGGYIPQVLAGVFMLVIGVGCLYMAARYTDQRYLLIGITLLFVMLVVFVASLFLVSKLSGTG